MEVLKKMFKISMSEFGTMRIYRMRCIQGCDLVIFQCIYLLWLYVAFNTVQVI